MGFQGSSGLHALFTSHLSVVRAALSPVRVALAPVHFALCPVHFASSPTRVAISRLADVRLDPSVGNLPGGGVLQRLTDGLGGWALVAALVGVVVGAAAWALGAHSQNYNQAFSGRRTVLVSGLAALLIGAGPGLVNFFFHQGTGIR